MDFIRDKILLRESVARYIKRTPGLVGYWPLSEVRGPVAVSHDPGWFAYPGEDVIVNESFATDSDWTKGDAAITISGGKATWSGAQAGNADLTATVAPLTNGVRYVQYIILSGVTAGTITPIFGTQAGTALSANGIYPLSEITANGTAFVLRGNVAFVGSCEVVMIRPANPMNGDTTGATAGQPVGHGNRAYSFDGLNDFVNIISSGLATAFNEPAGEIGAFGSGIMDGSFRALIRLQTSSGNVIQLDENNASGEMRFIHIAGGTAKIITPTGIAASERMLFNMSWSEADDELKAYINALQVGSTVTGLGTFVTSGLTLGLIGATTVGPQTPWKGKIDNVFIFDAVQSNAWRRGLARAGNVA